MPNPEQFDVKEVAPGVWVLDFPYNAGFITYLKTKVPGRDRTYDPQTNQWEVRDPEGRYLPALEGVAAQNFKYATKIFRRAGKLIYRNLITGHESVQEELFGGQQ